jgi:hypothetical protein
MAGQPDFRTDLPPSSAEEDWMRDAGGEGYAILEIGKRR